MKITDRLAKIDFYCSLNNLYLLERDPNLRIQDPHLVKCLFCGNEFKYSKIWKDSVYPRCSCQKVNIHSNQVKGAVLARQLDLQEKRLERLKILCFKNNLELLDLNPSKRLKEPHLVKCKTCGLEFRYKKIDKEVIYPKCTCKSKKSFQGWSDSIKFVLENKLNPELFFKTYFSLPSHGGHGRLPSLFQYLRVTFPDLDFPKTSRANIKDVFNFTITEFSLEGFHPYSGGKLSEWISKAPKGGKVPLTDRLKECKDFFLNHGWDIIEFTPGEMISGRHLSRCVWCGKVSWVQGQRGWNPSCHPNCTCEPSKRFRSKSPIPPLWYGELTNQGYSIPKSSRVRYVEGRRFLLVKHLRCNSYFFVSADKSYSDKTYSGTGRNYVKSCPRCFHLRYQNSKWKHLSESKRLFLIQGGYFPVESAIIRLINNTRYVLCRHKPPEQSCNHLIMVPVYDNSQPRACPFCSTSGTYRSKRELKFQSYLESLGFQVLPSYRKAIPPFELDLYLPQQKIAFEFNGYRFHHSKRGIEWYKPEDYHFRKTDLCLSKGIRLYHIWEDFPDSKVELLISCSLLGEDYPFEVSGNTLTLPRDLYPIPPNIPRYSYEGLTSSKPVWYCLTSVGYVGTRYQSRRTYSEIPETLQFSEVFLPCFSSGEHIYNLISQ